MWLLTRVSRKVICLPGLILANFFAKVLDMGILLVNTYDFVHCSGGYLILILYTRTISSGFLKTRPQKPSIDGVKSVFASRRPKGSYAYSQMRFPWVAVRSTDSSTVKAPSVQREPFRRRAESAGGAAVVRRALAASRPRTSRGPAPATGPRGGVDLPDSGFHSAEFRPDP